MIYVMNVFLVFLTGFVVCGCLVAMYFVFLLIKEVLTKEKPKTCLWRKRDDGIYLTGCSETFYDASETGNPITDWAKHCPYCGGEIEDKTNE